MKAIKSASLAASVLALGLGVAGNAQAGAYALAYNKITNGILDVLQPVGGGVGCSLLGAQNPAAAVAGVGSCAVGTAVVNVANPSSNTSGSSATLTGFLGAIDSDGPQAGIVDALPSNLGSYAGTADNTFTALGVLATNGARGDSELISEQSGSLNVDGSTPPLTTANPGNTLLSTISTESIAEVALVTNAQGTGQGNVSSGSLMDINVTIGTTGQIIFSFEADPFATAFLNADAEVPPSIARGILQTSISISLQGGGEVFRWTPDGLITTGVIFGGTELLDPVSLNSTAESQVAGATVTNDPTGDGIGGATSGLFAAISAPLAAGDYVINLSLTTRVEATKQVPEPGTLALMGLGLAGIGAAARRRKSKNI